MWRTRGWPTFVPVHSTQLLHLNSCITVNARQQTPAAPTSGFVLKEGALVQATLRRRAQQVCQRRCQHKQWGRQAAHGMACSRGEPGLAGHVLLTDTSTSLELEQPSTTSHTWPLEACPSAAHNRHRSMLAARRWRGLPAPEERRQRPSCRHCRCCQDHRSLRSPAERLWLRHAASYSSSRSPGCWLLPAAVLVQDRLAYSAAVGCAA